ncbi:hypothetical protein HELRODRAFT_182456 [Helobdella robusta]|uniref:RRM domain-containing protein n=1 Tax=Helobdella robusta TaxID=6412 RepID=T1FI81_HELRO|nr:hypothetical protein HELRODRAFT_182456 [Helobdella robusta]ESN90984.1 hypothetical protein HELRODRAFT_182456 [Helobdella robusta]
MEEIILIREADIEGTNDKRFRNVPEDDVPPNQRDSKLKRAVDKKDVHREQRLRNRKPELTCDHIVKERKLKRAVDKMDVHREQRLRNRTNPTTYYLTKDIRNARTDNTKNLDNTKFLYYGPENMNEFELLPEVNESFEHPRILKRAVDKMDVHREQRLRNRTNPTTYYLTKDIRNARTDNTKIQTIQNFCKKIEASSHRYYGPENMNEFELLPEVNESFEHTIQNFCKKIEASSHRNIPTNVDEKQLKRIFLNAAKDPTAKIIECRIMRDLTRPNIKGVFKSKGFRFIEFTKHENSLAAKATNSNPEIFGDNQRLIVEFLLEHKSALETKQRRLLNSQAKLKDIKSNVG